MLDWAVGAIGGKVVSVQALHGDQGPWRLSVAIGGRREHAVLRSVTPRIDAAMVATGAAALEIAERHGLRAPRLLAKQLDGRVAGVPVTLETFIDGTTVWPSTVSSTRLHTAGAALARVHAIALEPLPHLPFRPRPIAVDDFARDRRAGRMPTTPLLRTADELIQSMSQPRGATVFLHGDVWPGNLPWIGAAACALIDWKTAGVGDPGVDIGELRKQMAIMYGPDATAGIVSGWEAASGRPVTNVAYWDAVAALNTPTDLGVMTTRRDAFLRSAVERLDRSTPSP